jgi:hypothetical protein
MVRSENANQIGLIDVDSHELSRLFREIEEGLEQIADLGDEAMFNADQLERSQLLQDDLMDLSLVAARMLTDDGRRFSLDEVLESFGYTREELKVMPNSACRSGFNGPLVAIQSEVMLPPLFSTSCDGGGLDSE